MRFFRSALGAAAALATMALAACGDLPKPFQPEEKYLPIVRPVSPQAAELLRERNSVVIQSIANAPGGDRLAAAMAVALRNEGIAADVVATDDALTLAGIADVKTFPYDIEVTITWYVLDQRGRRIGQQQQSTRGRLEDWQEGNDRLLSRIALQGAPELGRLLKTLAATPGQPSLAAQTPPADQGKDKAKDQGKTTKTPPSAAPATAPPARPAASASAAPAPAAKVEALGFHVAKISGAPGDGNDSLTAGMRLALGRRGFTLFAKPEPNSFVIAGAVALTPFDQEREKITITWTVFDPGGKKMGDIEQSNVIPKGSLNGQWGGVAKEITVAAAEGLLDLLGKVASKAGGAR